MSRIERIPGLFDPHVHLREPGWEHKEDFESGTRAALAGGYTTVVDMPNNPIPTTTPEALQQKIDLLENRTYADVGLHFGAEKGRAQQFETVAQRVFGLKIYMDHTTGTLLIDKDANADDLTEKFKTWPRKNAGPILVHAEAASLERAIALSKVYEQRVHACHVSLAEEITMIREAKEEGLPITCEVAPHHLFMTALDAHPYAFGSFAIMKPPLARESDRQALWKAIDDGVMDMIASDHAPHTLAEKQSEKPPFGVVGLETTLPLMLSAVSEGRLTLDRLVELTSTNPKRIFKLKDEAETYTEIDVTERRVINAKNFYSKAQFSPFDGKHVTGKVVRVVIRGREVFNGQNIVGEPQGKFVTPDFT